MRRSRYYGNGGRGRGGLVCAGVCVCVLLVLPRAASAQWAFDVRAGVAGSSVLLEDQVASPRLAQALGQRFQGEVRGRAAVGPMVSLAARTVLNPRFAAELTLGWTATKLQAEDAAGTRDLQDLGVGHATLGVRTLLGRGITGSASFGAIRYFADEVGIFAEGSDVSPLLEVGAGVTLWRNFAVRATGQIHRFNNPFIRVLKGQEGSVTRWSVQAGWTFGGAR